MTPDPDEKKPQKIPTTEEVKPDFEPKLPDGPTIQESIDPNKIQIKEEGKEKKTEKQY